MVSPGETVPTKRKRAGKKAADSGEARAQRRRGPGPRTSWVAIRTIRRPTGRSRAVRRHSSRPATTMPRTQARAERRTRSCVAARSQPACAPPARAGHRRAA
ncbi:MAG: hypothetical protein DME16_02690 [Candidatus Rokuibacteriota bacterium]|nr:MAG: hypothetical protein DME16_02690 [Candidatus Rokubacteria bacterium]